MKPPCCPQGLGWYRAIARFQPSVSYYHMYQQISLLCHAEAISPAFHDPNLTDGHTAHRQLTPTRAGVGTWLVDLESFEWRHLEDTGHHDEAPDGGSLALAHLHGLCSQNPRVLGTNRWYTCQWTSDIHGCFGQDCACVHHSILCQYGEQLAFQKLGYCNN